MELAAAAAAAAVAAAVAARARARACVCAHVCVGPECGTDARKRGETRNDTRLHASTHTRARTVAGSCKPASPRYSFFFPRLKRKVTWTRFHVKSAPRTESRLGFTLARSLARSREVGMKKISRRCVSNERGSFDTDPDCDGRTVHSVGHSRLSLSPSLALLDNFRILFIAEV